MFNTSFVFSLVYLNLFLNSVNTQIANLELVYDDWCWEIMRFCKYNQLIIIVISNDVFVRVCSFKKSKWMQQHSKQKVLLPEGPWYLREHEKGKYGE